MNEWTADVDRRIYKALLVAMSRGFVQEGEQVVVLTGWKPGSGSTNTMRIITATDLSDKDLLPPITGVSSVPSFARVPEEIGEGDVSFNSLSSEENLSEAKGVKFF